jgi:peptide chain release factor 1
MSDDPRLDRAADLSLARLDAIEHEFGDLERSLGDPDVLADRARLKAASKRYRELEPIVDAIRRRRARIADATAADELLAVANADERSQLAGELSDARADVERIEAELRELMLPADPQAGRPVIVEIRGAEGGEEANLFARDLYEMYLAYANRQHWKVETLSLDPSDLGGVNQVTFVVHGDTAWSRLKHEGGPHRVQRVPVTESQGRIHTSSATVLVLPEPDEIDVQIDERDLDIDVYRSSGPGGQGVNTTDSAVRITHRPTGIVVAMQDERSQLQNKARAMQVLRARIYELTERERDAELSAERRAQVGGGGRSEKIRTYNFKENRLTDHRIGYTVYRLDDILAGDLDDVIDALARDERSRQLAGI